MLDSNMACGSYRTGMTLGERFWSKVAKLDTGCWEWTGAQHGKKYGHFRLFGRVEKAHRIAWMLTFGDIPDGQEVLHRCDNRPCVNPDHLFLGTNDDNLNDRQLKNRQARGMASGRAVLSESQVLVIRSKYQSDTTSSHLSLAQEYGVVKSTVAAILQNRSWKHLLSILLCWTVMASPVRNVDGDTFVADISIWLGLKSREFVRVLGVNTPEIHGATKDAGMISRQFTADWLALGDVTLKACGRDAFGRVLADVTRGESNLGKELIGAGLAKEYRR